MAKLQIKRHAPLYVPWYKRSWLWWYVAYGDLQPFKRFGASGWIYLSIPWIRRNWNYDGLVRKMDRSWSFHSLLWRGK